LLYLWRMERMVFLWIVRVDCMSHISRYQETLMDCSIVVFFLIAFRKCFMNSLSHFNSKIAICSLLRNRPNLFMVKQHYHVNLSIVCLWFACFH
jgi:hypothetical protein